MWRRQTPTDGEFSQEIHAHIALDMDRLIADGMRPQEARAAALRAFGNVTGTQERFYESRRVMWLDDVQRDVRYALRSLSKTPGFAAAVIFTLALGIGATTVVFSVAYTALVVPLPYRDFEHSVVFSIRSLTNTGGWRGRAFFPQAEFTAIRDQNQVLDELIGYQSRTVSYGSGRSTRLLRGANVTANTLDYLGIQPLLGRAFTANDGVRNAPPVFAMNYRLWQTEFGADPNVIGRPFVLDSIPKTLVAIMPPGFEAFAADMWAPTAVEDFGTLNPIGRLRPGVTLATAAADLDVIAHRAASAHPGLNPDRFTVVVQPFVDSLLGDFSRTLYGLLGAVLLLLFIASANATGLLLTRTIAREREFALRASIGATRGRLARQSLVETLVLAVAASVAGCLLASAGLKAVVALMPVGTLPAETTIQMNATVLLLALGISAATALLCGLAPAMHLARRDLKLRLASSAQGAGMARDTRLRRGLVVMQVALVMVLLVGAGALMREFVDLRRVDLGFNPSNILYVRPVLPQAYNTAERKNAFTRELLRRMEALPGVVSVAESMLVPPLTHDWSDTIIPGKPHEERWETRIEICSEGYFETIGLRLVQGSLFTESDVAVKRLVTVVNETFARRYFPGENPLGRTVKFQVLDRPFLDAPHDAYFEIIGVVADHRTWGGEWQTFPQAFFPYSVQGFSVRTFLARTAVEPDSLLKSVQETVWAIDPSVGIGASGTIERSLRDFYRDPQFDLALLGSFAASGVVLVAIGIFGIMAYVVSIQTHDIGVRMAIGATQGHIVRGVLRMGGRLVASGTIIGLGAAYGLSTVLVTFQANTSRLDLLTFAAVASLVVCVGLIACWVPAYRATRVDPMVALRTE